MLLLSCWCRSSEKPCIFLLIELFDKGIVCTCFATSFAPKAVTMSMAAGRGRFSAMVWGFLARTIRWATLYEASWAHYVFWSPFDWWLLFVYSASVDPNIRRNACGPRFSAQGSRTPDNRLPDPLGAADPYLRNTGVVC